MTSRFEIDGAARSSRQVPVVQWLGLKVRIADQLDKRKCQSPPGENAGGKPLALGCCWRYPEGMSSQTSQLLDAFDALPAEEKRIFTAEFLRRAIPFDSGPLDDEETAHAADTLFSVLDAEENDASSR
jgi:hypothetical protein